MPPASASASLMAPGARPWASIQSPSFARSTRSVPAPLSSGSLRSGPGSVSAVSGLRSLSPVSGSVVSLMQAILRR